MPLPSRRRNEGIVVGDRITVTVVEIQGSQVRLAIKAPKEIRVLRRSWLTQRWARPSPLEFGLPQHIARFSPSQ